MDSPVYNQKLMDLLGDDNTYEHPYKQFQIISTTLTNPIEN